MTEHAKLSASGSHRWLNCPGSVRAEESYPDTSSPAAQEGTAAHELAEMVLMGCAPDYRAKTLPERTGWEVTREMTDYVQQYVDYVRSLKGEQYYEHRVDFSDWVPEGFGTADAIVIQQRHASDILHVIDLKYGKGVQVEAENNTQGILYALGAYNDFSAFTKIERIVIHIVQPRLDHISTWEISATKLLQWGSWIAERAHEASGDDPERIPGEKQCQWCKAKATCGALKTHTEKVILSEFEQLDLPKVDVLNDEQVRCVLESKALVTSWFTAIEKEIKNRLKKGEEVPGFKLVEGRSLRKWEDEAVATNTLTTLNIDPFEHKLISPAKAEKALGKVKAKEIKGLIVKPAGAATLAPESDKRPPIKIGVDDFDDVS